MHQLNFDIAFLRSYVAGIELGSFARAADKVGRSTSAVSAQLKKLEEQAGLPLFRKDGRGLALTPAGEVLLGYARRLLELNDEAAVALRGVELDGWIKLGLQEDFGEALLPEVLGRFARAHPKVRIEAHVARNTELMDRLTMGQLDLALLWGGACIADVAAYPPQQRQRIAEPAMRWIASSSLAWQPESGEALPLIMFDRECLFQRCATQALDQAGIAWRIAFTSPSLAGLWAAAAAGLGVTVRTSLGLPPSVRVLDHVAAGLPALPALSLELLQASSVPGPPVERLAALLIAALQAGP
ncbi:LysR family transcriptional regulator [Janthinobacterium sp. BJB1]|uniref:LysR substrate-binding domain-containing protein n=1 Tax=Janthinobacterium sp. GW458P TaxID=1981504 RepID=UPI000A31EF5A|nr:LysR substrate-binding domain-containing protein [Janthinobacterium sp. GW458P]MBE3026725.1 LysR family transcriptional regulator [Janthinobacterium sp. GW458P]PHV16818.1 LysR family transcriptional regulator [Janthinobacterium sp. BJB303]PJC97898.1 LysR family transcriptional regulator [Janthinobacterium sp. BJB1]